MSEQTQEQIACLGAGSVNGRVIYGRVIAELGQFKSRRGQFTSEDLDVIVELGNRASENGGKGVKSRWKHHKDDALGSHLGYNRNFRREGNRVLADFYLSDIAFKPPVNGGQTSYGEYIVDLAQEDPDAFGSSLVLSYVPEQLIGPDGKRLRGENGRALPPAYRPKALEFVDVVGDGDAVTSFLSAQDVEEETDTRFGELPMSEEQKTELDAKLDVIAGALQSLVGKIEEHGKQIAELSAATELESVVEQTSEPAEVKTAALDATAVVREVNGLCEMACHPEFAGALAEKVMLGELSVAQVKEQLIELRRRETSLDSSNPTGQQPAGTTEPTREASLGAEYDQNSEVYRKCGLSRTTFVKSGLIEEGLEPETSPLLGSENHLTLI